MKIINSYKLTEDEIIKFLINHNKGQETFYGFTFKNLEILDCLKFDKIAYVNKVIFNNDYNVFILYNRRGKLTLIQAHSPVIKDIKIDNYQDLINIINK